jgi:hypothetical protein
VYYNIRWWLERQAVIKNINYQEDEVVVVVGLYGLWNNPDLCDSDA